MLTRVNEETRGIPEGAFWYVPEAVEDAINDAIGMAESHFGEHEVGLPRAYFEIEEEQPLEHNPESGMNERPSPILHRFQYTSFIYQLTNPPTAEDVSFLRETLFKDIASLKTGPGMLVWRLEKKIVATECLCHRCGGTFGVRTRVAFVPERIVDLRRAQRLANAAEGSGS